MNEFRIPETGNLHVRLAPALDDSQPNFSPAGWRAVQAAQRLSQLQLLEPQLASEWKGYPAARAHKDSPKDVQLSLVDWHWRHLPSARDLTMLASEILHHARTALDYCAFHVVWLDSGLRREKTKFPLVRVEERWNSERRNSVPGITDFHLGWIRAVQPFEGVQWSTKLLELSNRDKHWMAVHVLPTYGFRIDGSKTYGDPLHDSDYVGYAVEDVRLILNIAPGPIEGDAVGNGYPLVETLYEIVKGTVDLVNQFIGEAGYTLIEFEGKIAAKE